MNAVVAQDPHTDWQARVLRKNKYMLVGTRSRVLSRGTKQEMEQELKKLPRYQHAELYKQVAMDKDQGDGGIYIALIGLHFVAVVGDQQACMHAIGRAQERGELATLFKAA